MLSIKQTIPEDDLATLQQQLQYYNRQPAEKRGLNVSIYSTDIGKYICVHEVHNWARLWETSVTC